MKKVNVRDVIFYVLLLALLLWTISTLSGMNGSARVQYSDVVSLFEQGDVYSFTIDGDRTLHLTLRDEYNGSTSVSYRLGDLNLFLPTWAS